MACGYKETFFLGAGKNDWNIEQVYSYFDKEQVYRIKKEETEKQTKMLNFRFRLGRCADCKSLLRVPEIIFYNGTSICGKQCSCDNAKEHELELYDDETLQMVCPKCGGTLELQNEGLWD